MCGSLLQGERGSSTTINLLLYFHSAALKVCIQTVQLDTCSVVSESSSCSLVRLLCHCTTCHSLIPAREVYIPCDGSCNNGLCDYTCGTCVCHPFYTGEHCDRPLSECGSYDSHACIYLRVTLALTTGASLFPVLPCGNYYCFNEGTCEMDGSGREYCRCPQGFSGDYCLVNTGSECFTCNRAFFIPEQDGFSAKSLALLPFAFQRSLLLHEWWYLCDSSQSDHLHMSGRLPRKQM